jgi:hypothetical protein
MTDLRADLVALSRKFRLEADRLDEAFAVRW